MPCGTRARSHAQDARRLSGSRQEDRACLRASIDAGACRCAYAGTHAWAYGGTRASFYWSDPFAAAQQNLAQPEQERRLDLGLHGYTTALVYYLTNTPQGGPGRLVVSHPLDRSDSAWTGRTEPAAPTARLTVPFVPCFEGALVEVGLLGVECPVLSEPRNVTIGQRTRLRLSDRRRL